MTSLLRRWRCRGVAPLLVDAAEDALSAVDAARLEKHLARCEECRLALDSLRTVPELLRAAAAPVPRDSWERQRQDILRAVRTVDTAPPRSVSVPGWQVVSAMVAVGLVGAVVGVLLRDPGPRPNQVALSSPPPVKASSGFAEVLEMIPGESSEWEQANAAALSVPDEMPWFLNSADDVDAPGWADLRGKDVEELAELLGGGLVS